jgi:hypothetical protein
MLLKVPGIKVNERDAYGYTPLHAAVKNGCVENVRALFRSPDIDANAKSTGSSYFPLHWAAVFGYASIVEILLKVPGIKENEKDEYGHTPLHLAAKNGYAEIARALLQVPSIDVNAKDNEGFTPLYWAEHMNAAVAKVLPRFQRVLLNTNKEKDRSSLKAVEHQLQATTAEVEIRDLSACIERLRKARGTGSESKKKEKAHFFNATSGLEV